MRTEVGGGAFVQVSSSHADYQAITYPDVYTDLPFDYSGWTQYNVTTVGGTDPAGAANFSSCSNMAGDGTTDDSAALACMLTNVGNNGLLYLPNGTYRIRAENDGNAVWRPQFGRSFRGIIGESQSAILELDPSSIHPTNAIFILFDGEDAVNPSAATSWNSGSGGSAGDTVIPVASTAGFSATENASGNWVVLTSDPNSGQPDSCCKWTSRITGISAGTSITIEHPLPKDFDGGNAEAIPFNPSIRFVLDNMTIRWSETVRDHQSGSWTILLAKNMVETIINDVKMEGAYRQYITSEGGGGGAVGGSADFYVMHSDFLNPRWDKGANGYGFVLSDTDRGWIHDSTIVHSTGIAFSTDSDNLLVTFNHFPSMDPSCTDIYDTPTTGTQTSGSEDGRCDADPTIPAADPVCDHGDGNDCTVWEGFHSAAHSFTVGPDAYGHCSNSYNDAKGLQGDTGCRHAPAGKVYSCVEWHGAAGSRTIFARNYCEGGLWYDDESGFDDLIIHGNWLHDSTIGGGTAFNTAGGDPGEHTWRDVSGPTNTSWRHATVYSGNVYDGAGGFLGTAAGGFDAWGSGVKALDNAMEGGCYSENASPPSGCSQSSTGLADSSGTTFSRNNVGSDTYTGGATLPSLPGTSFTSWGDIPFSATPSSVSAPYVGVEMGDPDSLTPCLPARARLDGC